MRSSQSTNRKQSDKMRSSQSISLNQSDKIDITWLSEDIMMEIGNQWLTHRDVIRAEKAYCGKQRTQSNLFKELLTASHACHAVFSANPKQLLRVLHEDFLRNKNQNKSSIFFEKCTEITTPSGETIYDISAAGAVDMQHNIGMRQQVEAFVQKLPQSERQRFIEDWKHHVASQQDGGANFVKIDDVARDTISFDETLYATIYMRGISRWKLPLLQNPNGVVYFRDSAGEVHWFYADKNTKTLQEIEIDPQLNQEAYQVFLASISDMRSVSARRLNYEEINLFATIARDKKTQEPIRVTNDGYRYMRHEILPSRILATLEPEEFQMLQELAESDPELWLAIKELGTTDYKERLFTHAERLVLEDMWPLQLNHLLAKLLTPDAAPVCYHDTQYDFNRYYNTYLLCFELLGFGKDFDEDFGEDKERYRVSKGRIYCNYQLQIVQKEVMCLLKHYCASKSFDSIEPAADIFEVDQKGKKMFLYDRETGSFNSKFKIGFRVSNGILRENMKKNDVIGSFSMAISRELIEFHRFIENTKKNMLEFNPEDIEQSASASHNGMLPS